MRGPPEWRVAALAVMSLIVFFGLAPTHEALLAVAGEREGAATLTGHFLEYAALGFVLPVALRGWSPGWRVALAAGLLCGGLGAAIEAAQLALPYRSAQLGDAIVNIAGASLGVLLVSWVGSARARRSQSRHG
jgi:VanZ family protein